MRTGLVSKETYYNVKRDLLQCQKRPTTMSKETYYSVKRDNGSGGAYAYRFRVWGLGFRV